MSNDSYQSRHAETSLPEGAGLWRDGRYLVVELAKHAFPHRCLKTDLPLKDAAHTLVDLITSNVSAAELNQMRNLVVASTGKVVSISESNSFSESNNRNFVLVPLSVPLVPEYQAKLKSNFVPILALSSIALSVLLFAATMLMPFANHNLFFNPAIGFGFGVVGVITGLVLMRTRRVLSIKRLADGKVWLSGVHPDWLARLPEFQMSKDLLRRELKRAKTSRPMSYVTAIVLGIAAAVCVPIAVSSYLRGAASLDWPRVEGTLHQAVVTAHSRSTRRGSTRRWWQVEFNYSYAVNNKRFSGSSYEKHYSAEAAEANRQRSRTARRSPSFTIPIPRAIIA